MANDLCTEKNHRGVSHGKKTPISDSLVGVLSEKAATYKVRRNEDGKIVVEDPDVLDLYELDGVEIDPGTGTPLMPGNRERCKGNGAHDGFPLCCDECDYFLDCYPEYITDRMVGYTIALDDVDATLQAIKERMKKTRTYTFDEVLEALGVTHEELDAIPDADLELDE